MIRILEGDCRAVMATLPAASVDAVICDPPYELGFMGKGWDSTGIANDPATWREALRVLKPGGHLLAFSGTRTYHRMVCAIEDAGFEIRDQIGWLYGSGFPKSHAVDKGIDKLLGAVREKKTIGARKYGSNAWEVANGGQASHWMADAYEAGGTVEINDGTPITAAARQWQGWGTALKPAWEPIVLARKPLVGTVAANVLQHGTGALNIDASRIGHAGEDDLATSQAKNPGRSDTVTSGVYGASRPQQRVNAEGRWPANIIHDGSDEVLAAFPQARSYCSDPATAKAAEGRAVSGKGATEQAWGYADKTQRPLYADSGSAARFFYTAKASAHDRNDGTYDLPQRAAPDFDERPSGDFAKRMNRDRPPVVKGNHHPTVKPTDLMRYLCRLVTPPGGVILDPFMGSGSTLKAAELEGFSAIGIELDPAYIEIARRRIASDAPLFAEVA